MCFVPLQNNEPEALRSWKSALDIVYYHNAHRVPTTYIPKTDGERALQESIRELELQCRERVNLLEALRESRKDAGVDTDSMAFSSKGKLEKTRSYGIGSQSTSGSPGSPGWIGDGTIPSSSYPELMKAPSLPPRPGNLSRTSGESMGQASRDFLSSVRNGSAPRPLPSPPHLPSPAAKMPQQRQPSPEKKKLLTTLRGKEPKSSVSSVFSSSPRRLSRPAASKAAGLAWNSGSAASSSALPLSSSTTDLATPRKSISNESAPRRDVGFKNSSGEESPATKQGSYRGDYFGMSPTRRHISNDHATSLAVGAAAAAAHKPIETDSHTDGSFSRMADTNNALHNRQRRLVSRPKPAVPPRGDGAEWTNQNGDPPSYNQVIASSGVTSDKGTSDSAQQPQPAKASPTSQPRQHDVEPIGIPGPSSRGRVKNTSNEASPAREPEKVRVRAESKSSPEPSDNLPPEDNEVSAESEFDRKIKSAMDNLPKGIDMQAARQIVNEIVVRGDEVHWNDVAGLETAKNALKEAVVYPFLRPDLFMGLREPARGMLLFGPPGTGKTMLARAVATESQSTFFSVSASSLTSKWHGESEKLVRALFALSKGLAPSIIFVDEIDSLLSSRSKGGEVEASRRSKTEFLIQWSDLQRAAAGREQSEQEKKAGDASRVLVLAATNMPWDIDEAARRRFVRRQYIPLPEEEVRKLQFEKLLSHQKHELSDEDLEVLVKATEGKPNLKQNTI